MTRASLLHILDHVDRISDTEVRELEQLAAAFPYCQTAHVLLAKAAHDRGSMLASQRLRRAATYAADRELLRQLLEQPASPSEPATEPLSEPEVATPAQELAVATVAAAIPASHPQSLFIPRPEPTEEEATDVPAIFEETEAADEVIAETPDSQAEYSEPALAEAQDISVSTFLEDIAPEEATAEQAQISQFEANAIFQEEVPTETLVPNEEVTSWAEDEAQEAAIAEAAVQEADVAADPVAETAIHENIEDSSSTLSPESIEDNYSPSDSEPEGSTEPALEEVINDDLLPAVAPPIRPPVEAGISRFEFGLGEPPLPEPSSYQLPGLEQEVAEALHELPEEAVPIVTAPFHADEDLGYALSAGSRLGYDLQPHDGFTLDLPLESFFEPDALLLAHMAAHRPKPKPSSLDLINQFLKNQPRIKSPAGVPLPAEEQMDLSVRSNAAAPALASESLAKIMVRQGKKDKAIEIYERLMERQPEKKAYFSEQIQQLQQSPE